MGRSRLVAAAVVLLASAAGYVGAADLCEGCWEVGGRIPYLFSASNSGTEAAAGLGAQAGFRFKPFWSVAAALDSISTKVSNGPDESLRFLTVSFEYTLRSSREQRTRPYIHFSTGLVFDHISSRTVTIATKQMSAPPATSLPEGDRGLSYGVGVGGLTTLTNRLYLRYEGAFLKWSTFGVASTSSVIRVGLALKLGR